MVYPGASVIQILGRTPLRDHIYRAFRGMDGRAVRATDLQSLSSVDRSCVLYEVHISIEPPSYAQLNEG